MAIPLLIGLGIAGAAALGSATANAVGTSNAAAAQKTAAEKAMDLQRQMWAQQRSDISPWREAGATTLAQLLQEMQSGAFDRPFDASQLASDPGYQFRMAEGQKALERSAAARGMLASGGTMKGLNRYAQGYASDEFNNAYARHRGDLTDRFNRLAAISGVGQQAAQNLGQLGAQHSGQMSNLYGALGNAQAAGAIGTANAVSGGMQTLGNLAMMGGMGMSGGFGGMGGGGGGSGMSIPMQAPSYGPGLGYGGFSSGYVPSFGFGLNY